MVGERERVLLKKGEIEMDESYFGDRRIRGKKERGAMGKMIISDYLNKDKRLCFKDVNGSSVWS